MKAESPRVQGIGVIPPEASASTWHGLAARFLAYRRDGGTDLADEAMVNPAFVYVDHEHYEREIDAIFRNGLLPVALSADLRAPGDVVTTEVAGVPILVLRAGNGALQAFVNVCPHRGATLVARSGTLKNTIHCPFHGWTFGFDGTRRLTRSFEEGFGDVCDTTDLRPVAAWERCGFVYVATTDEVSDTAALDSLSMFAADFEALELDEYTLFREQVSAWPMNWKFPVDSFLETYHVPTLHRGSVAPFYYGTPVLFDARGWNARMCQWRRSTPDSLSKIAADEQFRKHGNLIFFLFPNVILNFPIPGCLEFWHLMPDGPGRVRATTRFYTNRAVESPSAFDFCNGNFELSNSVVYKEDFPLHLAVHKSMVSGAVQQVIYGRNEPGLIHFHQHLARRVGTEHG